MSNRARDPAQMLQDRTLIAEYYLKGWTQRAIAEKLKMPAATVKYDLRKIQDDWRDSTKYDFDLAKQQQLARIDLLEREAYAAWEGSKAPRERTRTRSARRALLPADALVATTSSAEKSSEQRDPDPRYLAVIEWCIDARAKLLGQYAPTQVGVRHTGAVTTITEVVYELPPDRPVAGLTIIGGQPRPQPALVEGVPDPDDDDAESSPTAFEQAR